MKSILLVTILASGLLSCSQSQEKTLNYLALGDSYAIGEAVIDEDRYPIQLASRLADSNLTVETKIVATSGWRTDDLWEGMKKENLTDNYDLVSLLIGVNNQFQGRPFAQYDEEFTMLLAEAIRLASGDSNRVFVVSIPDYYFTPFGQAKAAYNTSEELSTYNDFAEALCVEWGITFVNITPISENGIQSPELVAKDGLHPSGKQYELWVGEILKSAKSNLDYAVQNVR